MSPPSQSRSQTAPPPDASTPRLRSPKLPARVNPCCTACPSHPPDSVAKMESAFASLENPLRLAFLGMCCRADRLHALESDMQLRSHSGFSFSATGRHFVS